jgi:hypothetical protein
VHCGGCHDIEEREGIEPDCERCPIPPTTPDNARVMEMRSILTRLKGLMDAGTVLGAYGATRDELGLLAVVEDELRKAEKL